MLPDFFKEYFGIAMAKWDAKSCQNRIIMEALAPVPDYEEPLNPWPNTFGLELGGGPGSAADQWQRQVESTFPVLQPVTMPVAMDTRAQKNIMQWAESVPPPAESSSKSTAWKGQVQEEPGEERAQPAYSAFDNAWLHRKRRPEVIEAERQEMREKEKQAQTQTRVNEGNPRTLSARQQRQYCGAAPPPLIDLSEDTPTEEQLSIRVSPSYPQGFPVSQRQPFRPMAPQESCQPEPPPLIDFSEEPPAEEQPKFQRETKLRGTKSGKPGRSSQKADPAPKESSAVKCLSVLQTAMDQTFTLSAAKHRCSAFHVELFVGKAYIAAQSVPRHLRCQPRRAAAFFEQDEWPKIFASPAGREPGAETAFSKRLTNSWREARFLGDLQDRTPNGPVDVFGPTSSPEKQRYRIHCRNQRDGSEGFIDVADKEARAYEIKEVGQPLGSTRIHFPKRAWDACVFASGQTRLSDAQHAALENVAKTVQVTPRTEAGEPGKLYGRTTNSDIEILVVETRIERIYRSKIHSTDIFLNVTQVRRHMLEQRPDGAFMARAASEDEMLDAGLLWFEASLRSRRLNRALTAANADAGGVVTHTQIVEAKSMVESSLANLWNFGHFLVTRADAVGPKSRWLQGAAGTTQPSQTQTGIL